MIIMRRHNLSNVAVVFGVVGLSLFICQLPTVEGNPLVYPNKFSFQKTTSTSSTTPEPMEDHEHFNTSFTDTGTPSSDHGFRYDVVAWIGGSVLAICAIFYFLNAKRNRQEDVSNYGFQPVNGKGDFDLSHGIKPET